MSGTIVKVCSMAECPKTVKASGLCPMHYNRWKRHGDPNYVRDVTHGWARYTNARCRCEVCIEAAREYTRIRRAARAGRAESDAPHGTISGYCMWACRCEECRSAWAAYRREFLTKNASAREASKTLRDAHYKRNQARTGRAAVKAGQVWTGPELEMALRDDLTITEIALALGRTSAAVSTARHRARTEPKYVQFVGSSRP